MTMKRFLVLLCCFAQLHLSISGGAINSFKSVPDLEKSMYMVVDGYPCVRLLNISGEIGCSSPGRAPVVAPIIRFRNAISLSQSSALLLSIDEMPSFFSRISSDSNFSKNVGGVLVESRAESVGKLKGFSPDEKFPQAKFAPYRSIDYEWNPTGSGIMWNTYNFPIFLLSEESTVPLQEAAIKNEKKKKTFTTNVAEFHLVMETTKSGTHDSESCLKEETCLPLGGYSVWSSLPPINISSSEQRKPIILTVASMDSASFFRDKSLGAESPISGLISLLAAVDALSHVNGLNGLGKQLVFMVFTGESWGYLGSRRFLLELDLHSDAVNGLNSTLIESVMEIGSVGKASSQGLKNFFAHAAGTSSATNETLKALQRAQESLKSESVNISMANTSNPGLPPSSLMAFMRKNSLTSGVVLEDFDSVFSNKFYHSHLDDISNTNSSAIVAAATLVARTLYILASADKDLSISSISNISANISLVEELMGCLLNCNPGLSCELVKNYIASTSTCPNNYVGVVLGEPSSTPFAGVISDVSRFVWNFLADRTSFPSEHTSSYCPQDCSKIGGVCIRAETDGKGDCVISTTRYVPAYSTRLKFESKTWVVLPPNSSDITEMMDPVWTESNWEQISLRAYAVQDLAYDRLIMLGGFAVTASAYIAIVITRAFISKTMKED
ncbi:nicastrin isoform X2 [Malania oleifera]|uniref:nicastrin isoform X2 n=1 Tax=Malania oleifera TaxID=397392 RepID=UPI0025AE4770|nr:nicastrin isoform X2 [Malania oleifera]